MRFVCDACSAKYSIADERVKGRILKIRCKACNHIMTVREEEKSKSSRLPAPPPIPSDAAPSPRKSATQEAIDMAFGPPSSPAESDHTVVSHNPGLLMMDLQRAGEKPALSPPISAPASEWFVSFDGEQEGPLSLRRAKERIATEYPNGRECFGWKAGFFVWLPIEEIPEFKDAAKAAALAGKASNGHPAAPSAHAAKIPSQKNALAADAQDPAQQNGHAATNGAAGGSDLLITEASALINLDHLRAAAMARPAAGKGPAVGPTATLDPMPDAAPAGTPAPVVVVTGPAPQRASSAIKWIAMVAVVLVIGLGGSVAYLLLTQKTNPGPLVDSESANKKADDRPIAFFDGTRAPSPAGPDPRSATKRPGPLSPGTKVGAVATPAKAGPGPQGPQLNASQKNLASLYAEGGDSTAPRALPNVGRKEQGSGQVSQADILSVVTQNKRSLNMCYERVLKRDSTLKRARVVTQVKVGMSGLVTRVTVPDPQYSDSEIGQCLTQAIKKWRFPSSEAEYETEFPILLQAE